MSSESSPTSRRIVIWDDEVVGQIEVDHDAFVAFAAWINQALAELKLRHPGIRREPTFVRA